MTRHTPRRPGVTLMEVMIATAILAVGMLAIMALFPIGAVSMARAINQNRCADHGANSDAMFRYYWKEAWTDRQGVGGLRTTSTDAYSSTVNRYGAPGEEMILLLDRKRPFNLANPADIPATSSQPSFVVLVDPIGYQTQGAFGVQNTNNVSGLANLPARASLAAAEWDKNATGSTYRTRIRLTTLLDDFTFDPNGEPADLVRAQSGAPGQLERAGRYNVAWLIQRPQNNIPHEVHLFVLVFAGRSPTDTPSTEFTIPYTAGSASNPYVLGVDPKPNSVVFNLNGQPMPAVRKGGWVALSVDIRPQGGTPYAALDFYRVAAITEDTTDPANTVVTLEFEQPLRTYRATNDATNTVVTYNGTNAFTGTLVFFDNLSEVFDRGIVSAGAISGR